MPQIIEAPNYIQTVRPRATKFGKITHVGGLCLPRAHPKGQGPASPKFSGPRVNGKCSCCFSYCVVSQYHILCGITQYPFSMVVKLGMRKFLRGQSRMPSADARSVCGSELSWNPVPVPIGSHGACWQHVTCLQQCLVGFSWCSAPRVPHAE